tara:strand:- start:829 stop:1599 length:771 start_codon:yes stop_codon:yes gene_type:complete
MVKEAVILAAGMGSRLGNQNDQKPKGFLQLGNQPIIEESIKKLIKSGIEKIWIVTGYQSHYFKELTERYDSTVCLVSNEEYDQSGTLHSLSMIAEKVCPPFLLLESDIIFEYRAIEKILNHRNEDCLLLSGFNDCGDEVFVETDREELVFMSKNMHELSRPPAGELVGITKIGKELFLKMMQFYNSDEKNKLADYETDALVAVAGEISIPCLIIDDLIWSEIDDQSHLKRAKEEIYPKVIETDLKYFSKSSNHRHL